ncbi:flagellar biosynthesis protein FliP [Bacillus anthracis]|nr:flagellar biosynthesis protein FliP [Bacillus anthracis]
MRIKKQLSLLAVIFVFSIVFSIIFVNPAYAAQNGFINFENGKEFTSNSSVQLFALVTLLSLSSSIVLLFTHFTYFMIVLGITRQGLGVMNLPPNQVLVGLALFLSLFTMQPVLGQLKSDVWDPMTKEKITVSQAAETTAPIMKEYMSKHTYKHDLKNDAESARRRVAERFKGSILIYARTILYVNANSKGIVNRDVHLFSVCIYRFDY